MPALDEHGVHRAHRTSITRSGAACPSRPRHRGRRTRSTLVWHHVCANACIRRAYSAPLENTKNVTRPRCPGVRGLGRPAGLMALLSAGQRRSASVSPGGSRPPAARSHGAEGAGNRTRCRRGSRRDGAPGMERRPCAYPLAISARRQDEVRAAARSWLAPGRGADFVTGWMFAMDFVIGRRQPGRPVRRRWRGASGAGARPPALPRSGRPIRRTSRGGTVRN